MSSRRGTEWSSTSRQQSRIDRPVPGGAEAAPPFAAGPTSPSGGWIVDVQAAAASRSLLPIEQRAPGHDASR